MMVCRTELMNSPNMPPNAKPIVPAITILVGHDSNAAVIWKCAALASCPLAYLTACEQEAREWSYVFDHLLLVHRGIA